MANLLEPFYKGLHYGKPGTEKTRTSLSATLDTRMQNVLYLNRIGNPISTRDFLNEHATIVPITKLEDFDPLYDYLINGQRDDHIAVRKLKERGVELLGGYKTVILDSSTEVQNMYNRRVTGNERVKPGQIVQRAQIQHHGDILSSMLFLTELFYELPMHVIFTALETTKYEDGEGYIRPFFTGQSIDRVPAFPLVVGRMIKVANISGKQRREMGITEQESKSQVVMLMDDTTGDFYAKNQYSEDKFIVEPTMTKVLDTLGL